MKLGVSRVAAAAVLLLGCAAGASAQQAAVRALRGVETGQWALKDAQGTTQQLCLRNPAQLIQLQHRGVACSQFVVEETAERATVHYTCPGRGHGRTSITVETPRVLQVQTQGVANGAPFQIEYEARRTGACG